jgi:hypothetical protein
MRDFAMLEDDESPSSSSCRWTQAVKSGPAAGSIPSLPKIDILPSNLSTRPAALLTVEPSSNRTEFKVPIIA